MTTPTEIRDAIAKATPLLPCPFCGGRAELKLGIKTNYVMCLKCEVMGPNLADEKEIFAAWNTRTDNDALRARVALLEGALGRIARINTDKATQSIQYICDIARAALASQATDTGSGCKWCDRGEPIFENQHKPHDYHVVGAETIDCTRKGSAG